MTAPSFLVVDDDDVFRGRLARALHERGFEVREARSPSEAEALAREDAPEYAVVDLRMTEGSGLDVVRALLAVEPATRAVILTGYGSIANAVEAMKRGAVSYLSKPATVEEILRAVGLVESAAQAEAAAETPSLARVEWEHINRVLQDCGGNISQAARTLGLHRRSLQRKLQKYPSAR